MTALHRLLALPLIAGLGGCFVSAPVTTRSPPRTIDTCRLLSSMKPCWDKADDLLARIKSCGQLGQVYGDGVQEELTKRGADGNSMAAEAAAFSCSGLCAIKRNEPRLTWADACQRASIAMSCGASACPSEEVSPVSN